MLHVPRYSVAVRAFSLLLHEDTTKPRDSARCLLQASSWLVNGEHPIRECTKPHRVDIMRAMSKWLLEEGHCHSAKVVQDIATICPWETPAAEDLPANAGFSAYTI